MPRGTALITGGAKRIGKAIALALADLGFNIAIHYQSSESDAEAIQGQIQKLGKQCKRFRCNLNDAKEVNALIPAVADQMPDLSVLINNASIFERAGFFDTDEVLFDRHFNVNLRAPFFLSKEFAARVQNGQIINLLDTKITVELTSYFAYSLTKKALWEFTKMAAKELGPDIRVNGVAPGLILPSSDSSVEAFEKMGQKIPLRKTGGPDDIVKAVRYFIENDFITGEVIRVDGGEHLK